MTGQKGDPAIIAKKKQEVELKIYVEKKARSRIEDLCLAQGWNRYNEGQNQVICLLLVLEQMILADISVLSNLVSYNRPTSQSVICACTEGIMCVCGADVERSMSYTEPPRAIPLSHYHRLSLSLSHFHSHFLPSTLLYLSVSLWRTASISLL